MSENTRPCGTCLHLDARGLSSGVHYCWEWYVWRKPDEVVPDCSKANRATGAEPPGRIHFTGENER